MEKTEGHLLDESTSGSLKKSDRTRLAILNAAAKLFKDRGYTATTLRDVAEEAGMKAGSIYYHFDSKDEIMDEVLDAGLRAVYMAVREAIQDCPEGDSRRKIEASIRAHVRMLFLQGDYVSANIRLYSQLPEEIRQKHQTLRHEYADLWDNLLQEAKDQGVLRSDLDITPLRQFVLGALNWSVEWYDDQRFSVDKLAERCIKLIGHGMYAD